MPAQSGFVIVPALAEGGLLTTPSSDPQRRRDETHGDSFLHPIRRATQTPRVRITCDLHQVAPDHARSAGEALRDGVVLGQRRQRPRGNKRGGALDHGGHGAADVSSCQG